MTVRYKVLKNLFPRFREVVLDELKQNPEEAKEIFSNLKEDEDVQNLLADHGVLVMFEPEVVEGVKETEQVEGSKEPSVTEEGQ